MYRGEIHVAQEHIRPLLNLAEMFQICGLTDLHQEDDRKPAPENDDRHITVCSASGTLNDKNVDGECSPPKRIQKERDLARKQTFETLDVPVEWPAEDEIKHEEQPLFKSARKRKQSPSDVGVVSDDCIVTRFSNIPTTAAQQIVDIPKSPTQMQPTRLLLEEADSKMSFADQVNEESSISFNGDWGSLSESRAKQKVPAWSWSQLQEAITAVVTQRLRFTQASAQYNIPKGTLYDNILGKTHRMAILEELLLSPAEEAAVLEFCCDTSTSPFSKKTKKSLKSILEFLARFDVYRAQAERFRFGDKGGFRWWWAFCRKHSIVSLYYEGIKLEEETRTGGKKERRSDDFEGGETT
ncbi:uncharacterized protein LOC129769980 isoform X2 [Toxorhynchites rutilus septentrionalis]|nr:uncharacterized protein LOC129769980 isoform X2 [Toxorhynchites rutilus septentrionalis]